MMFKGAYLKVERANRHIDEIIRRTSPLDQSMFRFGWFRGDVYGINNDPQLAQLAYKPLKPISETISLIIGDAIHNLRSALDHAASEVVGRGKRIHFPFSKERKDLIKASGPALDAIQKALPNADVQKFILDEIEPCLDGNAPLWRVSRADNDDKHNFILPSVTMTEIVANVEIPKIRYSLTRTRVQNDANEPVALIGINNAPPSFANEYDCKIAVDVRFSQVSVFGDEPVVPTLVNSAKVVTETLDTLKRFVLNNKP